VPPASEAMTVLGSWHDKVALHVSGKAEAVRQKRICEHQCG